VSQTRNTLIPWLERLPAVAKGVGARASGYRRRVPAVFAYLGKVAEVGKGYLSLGSAESLPQEKEAAFTGEVSPTCLGRQSAVDMYTGTTWASSQTR